METQIKTGKQRYEAALASLKTSGKKGFIPFTMLGWPDKDTSKAILKALVEAKPAALELGFPFSDPVADGPIIQEAVYTTLNNGFKMTDGFELIRYARALDPTLPIGLLVYCNTVLSRGYKAFYEEAAKAGVDGILIADLPPEVADEACEAGNLSGLAQIFIVSPLTSSERLKTFANKASGFLYVVSRLGITGTEARYDNSLEKLLTSIRIESDLPLYVGFGVSEPEQAKSMIDAGADGYITGSRIIQLVKEKGLNALPEYLSRMVAVGQ